MKQIEEWPWIDVQWISHVAGATPLQLQEPGGEDKKKNSVFCFYLWFCKSLCLVQTAVHGLANFSWASKYIPNERRA